MGRHKTATALLDARGAFSEHPERRNKDEPVPEGDPPNEPPDYLDEKAARAWRDILDCAPGGVITSSDRISLEVMAVLLAEFREKGARMQGGLFTRLCALLGRFGLDPSGRAGVKVPANDRNEFDDD